MSFHTTREDLFLEYLKVIREQHQQQTNIMISWNRSNSSLHTNIRPLLQRFFEADTPIRSSNYIDDRRPRRSVASHSEYFRQAESAPARLSTSPLPTTSQYRVRPPRSARDNRTWTWDTPSRPRWPRRRRNAVATQTLGNHTFQNLLHTTLQTPSSLNPLTRQDISNNTAIFRWADISSNTSQNLCPISQDLFRPDDIVMRIRYCRHIFLENHLRNYLENYDYRCPVCRLNLRTIQTRLSIDASSNIGQSPPPQTMQRDISNQILPHIYDISFNGPMIQLTNDLWNNPDQTQFSNVVNAMSNALLSSLSNTIRTSDNSGNSVRGEMSLFFPTNNNNN